MGALNFPNISKPSYPLNETPEDIVIRSQMEDGTVKTRARYTRNRFTYELNWRAMPDEEKQILEAFLRTTTKNGALPFSWTHPQTNVTKIVMFAEMPSFALGTLHYWRVSLKLVEV